MPLDVVKTTQVDFWGNYCSSALQVQLDKGWVDNLIKHLLY